MRQETDLLEILKYIDPSKLDYTEWVNVGMALKTEGYSAYDWDVWSARDGRYKQGECYSKWESFKEEAGSIVTAGTIVQLAKEQGFAFATDYGHALGWDDVIQTDEQYVVIDKDWLEGKDIEEPRNWNPAQEIIKYLSTLFESSDNVGYVTTTYENEDGKHLPAKGNYDRTAGKLIEELSKCDGDIGAVLGDYNEAAGAWIRFNPLDGKGVKNDNVTEYRYALVESDDLELDKQNAIIRELELPVAALVYSGGKSVHAIVKIEADTYEEYRKRVNYLYDVCKKNGLTIDTQNRNPSRLSRMPGIMRNGKKQFLMDTHIGKDSWLDWEDWIEGINDDLPDPEPLEEVWEDMPELAPPLIHNVLRKGHKMLIAGPSKAGKSFALIGLTIAIAEGLEWMGFKCEKGRVLYVNLELDRASALHRFKDVYKALGVPPKNIKNIEIWNLRGKTSPMDKLTPKLIRRSEKRNYDAVIIDPIYKVLTGDENSASEMAVFTNLFDRIALELGSSVIYCHHHSKGSQGGKRSIDRSSGSGVFARDPDAILDLVELELTDAHHKVMKNKALAEFYTEEIKKYDMKYFEEEVGLDDVFSAKEMRNHIGECIDIHKRGIIDNQAIKVEEDALIKTAWRLEGTLREYASFKPVNMWFDYPIHKVDKVDALKDAGIEGESLNFNQRRNKGTKRQKSRGKKTQELIESALDNLIALDGETTYKDVLEYMQDDSDSAPKTDKSIRDFINKNQDKYELIDKEGDRTKYIIVKE